MPTVLLTLDAPTQSWNSKPGNAQRNTDMRPTKSAVVGLVANALGRDYDSPVDDLAALDFAVRCDRRGTLERDYHTVGDSAGIAALPGDLVRGIPSAKQMPWQRHRMTRHLPVKNVDLAGKPTMETATAPVAKVANPKQVVETFLVGARFTVALSGASAVIDQVAEAVQRPARAVFLGKRAHVPAAPLFAGITDHDTALEALLSADPGADCDAGPWEVWHTGNLLDAEGEMVYDQPQRFGVDPQYAARQERRTCQYPQTDSSSTEPSDADFFIN